MNCPKCKTELADTDLKCPNCGVRVRSVCPSCSTLNLINKRVCVECGYELLKICQNCKCANLPTAKACRKCGTSLTKKFTENPLTKQSVEVLKPQNEEKSLSEKVFVAQKTESVKNDEKTAVERKIEKVLEEKNIVLDNVIESSIDDNIVPTPVVKPDELEKNSVNSEKVDIGSSCESVESSKNHEKSTVSGLIIPEILANSGTVNVSSRVEAKDRLVAALLDDSVKIISLSGDAGVGKSIVLKFSIEESKVKIPGWMYAKATPLTQLTPCGLIQDSLLTFFNIAPYCQNALKFKKDSFKFFHNEFPELENNEIFDLLNFLYPTNSEYYEKIYLNKEKTFNILTKVFNKIIENNQIIFVLDNFDEIDGMSYEFLYNYLQKQNVQNSMKLVVLYKDSRPVRGYFNIPTLSETAYVDISLGVLTNEQMETFVSQYGKTFDGLDDNLKKSIFEQSGGNPAYLEQLLSLVFDSGFSIKDLPKTFPDVVAQRMTILEKNDNLAYGFLIGAAVLGVKFSPQIVAQLFGITDDEFNKIAEKLISLNYISPVSDFNFEFKNSPVWGAVFDFSRSVPEFKSINEKLFELLSEVTLSADSLHAIISQNLEQKLSALTAWTEIIKLASYIGDVNLYIIAQKQSLALIEDLEGDNSSLVKNNIHERLGKILTNINTKEAAEYLPLAIENSIRNMNLYKELELTGYLAKCCMKNQNYFGAVECIEAAIDKLDVDFDLERALMKSRSVLPLLKIGNCAEVVNLIDNEIIPVFEKYLDTSKPHKIISIQTLFEAWIKTYLNLAIALACQGDGRSFEVLNILDDIILKNNVDDELFICKTKLAKAFASTMKGDLATSELVLEDVLKKYRMNVMDNVAILEWNFVNVLNHVIHKDYDGLNEELFQVVEFANNIGDDSTKNILKTFLGKIFKDKDLSKQALEIYNEQITFFAKEKISIGAILTWYLIGEATLVVDGPDRAIEIAQKALDVAQNPKINNYTFIILLNKLIAEAYMALSDFESSKMYIEKAILFARKFDSDNLLSQSYLLYGKYLQDLAIAQTESRLAYVQGASKLFKKALSIARNIGNAYLVKDIEKANSVLNSFCQLNGLLLK